MSTDFVAHPSPESYASLDNQNSLPLILAIVILSFSLLGFVSLYLCRNIMLYLTNDRSLRRREASSGDSQPCHSIDCRGLDPSLISSFPTFPYSRVKDLHLGNLDQECSVCLGEFSEDDLIRLITVCRHAFHSECIDLWFELHTSCPVCRRELVSAEKLPDFDLPGRESEEIREREELREEEEESHRISFKDEEQGDRVPADLAVVNRLMRSYSTGHDRYTLRLTQNVQERMSSGTSGYFSDRECARRNDVAVDLSAFSGGVAASV